MKSLKELRADHRIKHIRKDRTYYFITLSDGWLMHGTPGSNVFVAYNLKELCTLLNLAKRVDV